MSRPDEAALEAACARGEAAALDQAVALLDADNAYTRARASEMLAGAPEPELARRVAERFARGFPSTLWWRAVALFAEEVGRPPGGEDGHASLTEGLAAAAENADPDALFHALRAVAAARVPGRSDLAVRFVPHKDDEVALRAALVVAEERTLTGEELARVQAIRGEERLHALILRSEQGDRTANAELAAAVPSAGPFAYHVLDTLEAGAGEEAIPPLRRLYGRRFGVGHVAARAAATAFVLGDSAALPRLRALTRALRRDVRAVAWAELARVGEAADLVGVRALVEALRPEAAFVVSELWRGTSPEARLLLDDAFELPSVDVRAAACDAASNLPPEPALTARLEASRRDANPLVREAAQRGLDAHARPREKP